MSKPVHHLHKNKLNRDVNILLLLIPSFIFIVVMFLLSLVFRNYYQLEQIAVETNPETAVLGDESGLDN